VCYVLLLAVNARVKVRIVTAIEFGDIEPDDVYSAEGELDPVQVARRLHEIREFIGGGTLPRWRDLPDEDRLFAIVLMVELIRWLRAEGAVR
jgi:hypothetical protein